MWILKEVDDEKVNPYSAKKSTKSLWWDFELLMRGKEDLRIKVNLRLKIRKVENEFFEYILTLPEVDYGTIYWSNFVPSCVLIGTFFHILMHGFVNKIWMGYSLNVFHCTKFIFIHVKK